MKYINLYHKEFQPYRTPALVRVLQLAAICLVAGLIVLFVWHSARIDHLRTRIEQVETRRERLSTELSSMEQRLEAQQSDPRLQRRIDSLRQKLKVQRPLFDTLEQLRLRRGHSIAVLTALAQEPLSGVWFTRIRLDSANAEVNLEGAGDDAEHISGVLDNLMSRKIFAGREFEQLRIKRGEDGLYTFSLASRFSIEEETP
ncbi:MAG: PilN domain-containing protein [Thermodesulfobacteriota bacterium]